MRNVLLLTLMLTFAACSTARSDEPQWYSISEHIELRSLLAEPLDLKAGDQTRAKVARWVRALSEILGPNARHEHTRR